VQLKHAGRSVMVELNQTFEEGEPAPAPPAPAESAVAATASAALPPPVAITPAGDAADAVRLTAEALKSAPNVRWPARLAPTPIHSQP